MSLVEKCWMITSKFSVIAILIITGICFGAVSYTHLDVYKRQGEYYTGGGAASCHPADVVPAKRRFGRSAWSQAVL